MFFQTKAKGNLVTADRDRQLIRQLLEEDANSVQKRKMEEGERYFLCQNDILEQDFQVKPISESTRHSDGSESENMIAFRNPNRSNHKIAHPFHHILVTQKVAYLVGKEPTILVGGKEEEEYQRLLFEAADPRFNRMLMEWIVGASNKGIEYVHFYYDEQGELQYTVVPAQQLIPFYEEGGRGELTEVLRYYPVTSLENGKKVLRKRLEWWTKEDVTYFVETKDGSFSMDEISKSPHWMELVMKDGVEKKREDHGWGRLPFIPLRNNSKEMTDLELIKGLVDAYDLIASEGTNHLLDLVDLYWVIEGYAGETASAIAKKLQINKAVHISDPAGKVEAKQVDLSLDGRVQWLKLLRKDIFHFGMGVDTDSEDLSKAPSGISLKFQYAMFHLKVNAMVPEIRLALQAFFRFFTEDWNRRFGKNFDWKKVEISLNFSAITDDTEIMEIIKGSTGLLSNKTLLSKHPFVDDVNGELLRISEDGNGFGRLGSRQGE